MSNELTTKADTLPFWDSMEAKDFAIPSVTIGQPTSQKGEAGKFNYNNGKAVDEFKNCKLIVPRKTRVMYGKGFNDPSVCSSDNFQVPSARVTHPVSKICATCPLSQWGEDDPIKKEYFEKYRDPSRNKLNQPLCAETYNLLMADENWSPFFIRFQKTQLKIVSEKLFSRLKGEFFDSLGAVVSYTMKLVRTDAYYSVSFDDFKLVDDPEMGEKLYRMYSVQAENLLSKEHERMDNEARERVVTEVGENDSQWPDVPQPSSDDFPI